ncbi:hypothetical protein M2169_000337 [Streptomyces sp. MJP52]|nr:hypothetical protein [Streptomyces sp. MJP52]
MPSSRSFRERWNRVAARLALRERAGAVLRTAAVASVAVVVTVSATAAGRPRRRRGRRP